MYIGISPLRISLSGGGTDMPEYYEKFGGNVVSTAINLFTYVMIKPRPGNLFQAFSSDFEIHQSKTSYRTLKPKAGTEIAVAVVKYLNYKHGADFLIASDVSPGSGLGASSSLTVNFVKTILSMKLKTWSKNKVAETAFHIERKILHHPVGKQDQYIASFGGFNYIKFKKNRIQISPIKLNRSVLAELENNLLLFFIGTTRNSATVLSRQLSKTKTMNQKTLNSLHQVKGFGEEFHNSLKKSDIAKVGELLHRGWEEKKKFTQGVTNKKIDLIYNAALKSGVTGGKLTGAGGGGHMLFYCESPKQKNVITKMKKLGLTKVDFNFHGKGAQNLNLYDFKK
jgi:D-glycero-alpha-D-manno-heptose-7-phosphate kinase